MTARTEVHGLQVANELFEFVNEKALPGTGAAKYPPVTGAEYLRMRLDATYTEKVTA